MSKAYCCDECGRYANDDNWLELRRVGGRCIGEPDEWHFCGWPCLETFVGRRKERSEAAWWKSNSRGPS